MLLHCVEIVEKLILIYRLYTLNNIYRLCTYKAFSIYLGRQCHTLTKHIFYLNLQIQIIHFVSNVGKSLDKHRQQSKQVWMNLGVESKVSWGEVFSNPLRSFSNPLRSFFQTLCEVFQKILLVLKTGQKFLGRVFFQILCEVFFIKCDLVICNLQISTQLLL